MEVDYIFLYISQHQSSHLVIEEEKAKFLVLVHKPYILDKKTLFPGNNIMSSSPRLQCSHDINFCGIDALSHYCCQ